MNIESLLSLVIGILILVLVGYLNWYGTIKVDAVKWIAKHIFRNGHDSERSADGLFMTITSILLAAGGILVVFSF